MGRNAKNNKVQEVEKTEEPKIIENDAIVINEEDIVDEKELSENETIEVIAPEVIIEEKSEEKNDETSAETNKKYKALVSFSGLITMALNEIREISNEEIVKDLLKAGYIEEVK